MWYCDTIYRSKMSHYTYTVLHVASGKSEQACISDVPEHEDVYDRIMHVILAQVRHSRMGKLLKDYDGDILDLQKLREFVPHPFKNYIPDQDEITRAFVNALAPSSVVDDFSQFMSPKAMLRGFMISFGSIWEINENYRISNIQKTDIAACTCPECHI